MSIRIFKSALIRHQLSQQELDDLVADFLIYKQEGVLPDTFGRDALYDDDATLPLVKRSGWHISISPMHTRISLIFSASSNAPAILLIWFIVRAQWSLTAIFLLSFSSLKRIKWQEITTICTRLVKWLKHLE